MAVGVLFEGWSRNGNCHCAQWRGGEEVPRLFVMRSSSWRSELDINAARWYNTICHQEIHFLKWKRNPISPVYVSFEYKSESDLLLFLFPVLASQNWKHENKSGLLIFKSEKQTNTVFFCKVSRTQLICTETHVSLIITSCPVRVNMVG